VLHYSRDEDGEEFNSEDMVEMYDGIYVKAFVIFFGELIRYIVACKTIALFHLYAVVMLLSNIIPVHLTE
jgi:hypothetical protein